MEYGVTGIIPAVSRQEKHNLGILKGDLPTITDTLYLIFELLVLFVKAVKHCWDSYNTSEIMKQALLCLIQ